MYQMTVSHVKRIAHSDKPTVDYHRLASASEKPDDQRNLLI